MVEWMSSPFPILMKLERQTWLDITVTKAKGYGMHNFCLACWASLSRCTLGVLWGGENELAKSEADEPGGAIT